MSWRRSGLPEGEYRVRVFFNWDDMSSNLNRVSKWVGFSIK